MFRPPHISLRRAIRPARGGFTLVEMLVATTLVVMMLMLFAQIFGDTVRIMRNQQALSQNDQKARSVDSQLRVDLEKATFRQVRDKGVFGITPLRPSWPVDAERQRGYFYFSENDPNDPTDDVLQFTIDMRLTHRNSDVGTLRGKATRLGTPNANEPNQPDNDDGIMGNGVGESPAAEVSYFLRGGNLYRRTLLLRNPPTPATTSAPGPFPIQPGSGADGATVLFQSASSPVYPNNFWEDFDYSAWNRQIDQDGDNMVDEYQVMFNGVDSLQNVVGATSHPLGIPYYRYGHMPLRMPPVPTIGRPMEFVFYNSGANTKFIGRFVQEETSSTAFDWPAGFSTNNPYYRTYPATVDAPPQQDDILDLFAGGDRAGEDLLLSGVESFDLEVWDPGLNSSTGGWADLGHDLTGGQFRDTSGNFTHSQYGPRNSDNWLFDTWHPRASLFSTFNATTNVTNQPPWRATTVSAVPSGSNDVRTWSPNSSVTTSTYLFPRISNPSGFSATNPNLADDDSYFYQPVFINGNTGTRQPDWPREPGATVIDGGVIWQCFDNRVGLQAIKITVRFRDPGNGSPRQVSVIHSFVE
ncbi:hypothetical protein Pan44_36560 [Caulifigura coniformis]|uniref:Uncharacterized protein n=1 Tax=Caulifigura coniformis TaxID=2527983 RepID=A0A517SHK2_9PLAN|nr:hypothetical protein [Caulifigura coniformis]QDT55610.1 hypothetical protein Pan44_36560 [Caulifigura coniformis]